MTVSVNPILTKTEQVVHDLFWVPLTKAAELKFPLLNVWLIKGLFEAGMEALFGVFKLLVDINFIRFKNAEQQAHWDEASSNLKNIFDNHGVNSNEYQTTLAADVAAQIAFTRVSLG